MQYLKNCATVIGALCFSFQVAAQQPRKASVGPLISEIQQKQDRLTLYFPYTEERITINRYRGEGVKEEVNWFLRDWRRTNKGLEGTAKMKPELLDVLGEIKDVITSRHPNLPVQFEVVSAYRSPQSNEGLRSKGGSQAKDSRHIRGEAIDIRVPGVSTVELRDIVTCIMQKRGHGGIGYYASDKFVHVDVDPGDNRYWPSRDYLKKLHCH